MAIDPGGVYHPNFRIWERSPIYLYMLLNVVVGSLSAFGLSLSAEQVAAVMGISNVVLTLLYGVTVTPIPTAQAAVQTALFTPVPQTDAEAKAVTPTVQPAVGRSAK